MSLQCHIMDQNQKNQEGFSKLRNVVTIIYLTQPHFYRTNMNKTLNNHIYYIENNFLSVRQKIGVFTLVKVELGGDFQKLTIVR